MQRGQHGVSAGLISTGDACQAAPAGSSLLSLHQKNVFLCVLVWINIFRLVLQWPTILESSTPSWPKWQSLDGRDTMSCNWLEFQPHVDQSRWNICASASHAMKDEFEGVCLEWLLKSIKMDGRVKVVWLLPFGSVLFFFFLLESYTSCNKGDCGDEAKTAIAFLFFFIPLILS